MRTVWFDEMANLGFVVMAMLQCTMKHSVIKTACVTIAVALASRCAQDETFPCTTKKWPASKKLQTFQYLSPRKNIVFDKP